MRTNPASKNLTGATVCAAFIMTLAVCLLFVREKLNFGHFNCLEH
jgi:hypothetical protein